MEYKTSEKKRQYNKKYYIKHKERLLLRNKEWMRNNPEHRLQYQREWQKRNPELCYQYSKKWREKNREYDAQCRKRYMIGWRKRNQEKTRQYMREWEKEKRRNDPKFCLNNSMRTAVYHALKQNKAGRRWETLVGYTAQDLMNHLEAQFDENMFWHNYGSYWHIDHRKPKSLFHFTSPEDQEFKDCWALNNLQPMEAMANMRKGNRYKE